MTALPAEEASAPDQADKPVPDSPTAPQRDWIAFGLTAAALLALWLLAHPYAGIIHDARLYVGRALADLDPQGLGQDLLFAHDGQSGFTVYRPLIRAGVVAFGAGPAALSATLVNLCLWFAAAAAFLSRYAHGRRLAAALIGLAILSPEYGGFDVFRYGEAFASPRPLAEAAVMAGLALLATGRIWWAILPMLAAGVLHPVMALPGVLIAFLVHAERDRRLWLLPVVGGLAALLAAALHLPLADRLLAQVDPAWNKVLEARTPYLFAGWWRPGDWGRTLVQFAVVGFAAHGVAGRLRSTLVAILAAAGIGLLATLILCDGLRDVLALQLQPWRALWPLTVAANAAIPLVTIGLWRRGDRGWAAAALLLLAWLTCEYGLGGLAACVFCIVGAVGCLRASTPPTPLIARAVVAAAAIVGLAELGSALWAAIEVLSLAPPPGSHSSLLSLWRSGAPTGLILLALGAAAWRWRGQAVSWPLAGAALAAALLPTLFLWDDRSLTEDRIESGRPDAALAQALGPERGGVLWISGDAQPWLLARRPSWATSIQGASVVFSRDLAMAWEDRMQRLIGLGFATQADRAPFTPAKHSARAHATEASIAACGWADRPAAILLAGHRPVPGAYYWKPDPAEMRLMSDGRRFFWRAITEYTVVRCSELASRPPETPPPGKKPSAVSRPAG